MIESLDVILWDKKVGTLVASREGHRSKACFYFDSDYVRDGYDIAPLRAPVKGVAAQRGLPVYPMKSGFSVVCRRSSPIRCLTIGETPCSTNGPKCIISV